MAKVNVEEIQQNLSACLDRVQAGETFVILRDGKPVAELKPTGRNSSPLRPFGLCAGQFKVPDDFDAPMPEDWIEDFLGQ